MRSKESEKCIQSNASGRNSSNGKKNKKNRAVVKSRPIFKPKPCEHVEVGQIVLCKMRGFAEWPGTITDIQNNLISIKFFGDNTTHKAAKNNFFTFEDCTDIILNHLRTKKNTLYAKSVKEAEYVLGIPHEKSIFNQVNN